jgi:hypothetical protein
MVFPRVLFVSRLPAAHWERYFPSTDFVCDGVQFVFDLNSVDYDWIAVYEDLPEALAPSHYPFAFRGKPCHQLGRLAANTILVTTEPETIKTYETAYTQQFTHVVTSQPYWALSHPSRFYRSTCNHWYYGAGSKECISRSRLLEGPTLADKTGLISVMGSKKRSWWTRHRARNDFIMAASRMLPGLHVHGRGFLDINDKLEALDPYCYHLAIENHVGEHHITEKLSDAFLGRCLPFYYGAPNASDYFPSESFIPIRIDRPDESIEIISEAVSSGQWRRRRESIEEARRLVLEKENLFCLIASVVHAEPGAGLDVPSQLGAQPLPTDMLLLGRHQLRRVYPFSLIGLFLERIRNFIGCLLVRCRS